MHGAGCRPGRGVEWRFVKYVARPSTLDSRGWARRPRTPSLRGLPPWRTKDKEGHQATVLAGQSDETCARIMSSSLGCLGRIHHRCQQGMWCPPGLAALCGLHWTLLGKPWKHVASPHNLPPSDRAWNQGRVQQDDNAREMGLCRIQEKLNATCNTVLWLALCQFHWSPVHCSGSLTMAYC